MAIIGKLGRRPSVADNRTIHLRGFIRPEAIPTPTECDYRAGITDWGTMGNDQYGNCVIVTAAHALLAWRANESHDAQRITDSAVIDLSRTMGALDGFSILDRLKWWNNQGMWANRLWAFASYASKDPQATRSAIYLTGCADIGLAMPTAWQDKEVWDTGIGPSYRPGTWGGHSVPLVAYNAQHAYAVTWGHIIPITWRALATYCDEAHALIDPEWIAIAGMAPNGLDLAALHAAVIAAKSQPPTPQ
jgi:hypothetical protein